MNRLTKEQLQKARDQYAYQKSRAINSRNIEWLLTFEEWITWWLDSGHYHERGRYRGQYQMTRFGDIGPYSLDNIECKTKEENTVEGNVKLRGRKFSEEYCKKMSEDRKGIPKPFFAGNKNRFHKDNLTDELSEKIENGRKKAIEKNSKRIQTPDGIFDTQADAARFYNVDNTTIINWKRNKPSEFYNIT